MARNGIGVLRWCARASRAGGLLAGTVAGATCAVRDGACVALICDAARGIRDGVLRECLGTRAARKAFSPGGTGGRMRWARLNVDARPRVCGFPAPRRRILMRLVPFYANLERSVTETMIVHVCLCWLMSADVWNAACGSAQWVSCCTLCVFCGAAESKEKKRWVLFSLSWH
jgi:hypothetical protein